MKITHRVSVLLLALPALGLAQVSLAGGRYSQTCGEANASPQVFFNFNRVRRLREHR